MKLVLMFFGVGLLLYTLYGAYLVWAGYRNARPLVANAVPFSREGDYAHHMLVLGDSTAVGVGATPSTSVPGRLAEHLHASVENYAKSGAKVGGLSEQRAQAKRAHYDTTLVQIGANDVVSTGNLTVAAAVFEKELAELTKISERVIVLTAGDIGDSGVFIRPLGAVISYRTRVLREYFKKTCEKYGAVYVDIYAEPNVLARDPGRYYAADNFHLSSEGYGYWYEITKKYITK